MIQFLDKIKSYRKNLWPISKRIIVKFICLFSVSNSRFYINYSSSFPVFLNCSRESREVPEFIVPTLIEKNTNFFG